MRIPLAVVAPYLLLFLACLALYVPGLESLPVTDRDEARFVQATRQMIQSRDYVVVRFQEELRAKKPAGIYWLQSIFVRLAGDASGTEAWPYRLPSLAAAIGSVLCTFFFATRLFDRRVAWCASIGLASSLLLGVEAHLATTDATLLLLVTIAQGCLGLLYIDARASRPVSVWVPVTFWVALGAGILIKGPVGPAIAVLTMLSLSIADREMSWLRRSRPLIGIALVCLIVLPWVWLVTQQTEGLFLSRAVREDLLPKLMSGHEGHGAPPGLYAIAMAVTLWPASAFLWPAVSKAWAFKSEPALRFVLAWALPAWIMFELLPTKLPHYTLPLHPAFVLIIAAMLLGTRESMSHGALKRWIERGWSVVWSVATIGLIVLTLWLPIEFGPGAVTPAAVIAALAMLVAGVVFWLRKNSISWRALLVMAGAGAVAQIGLIAGVAPRLSQLWLSERLVAARDEWDPHAPILAIGYEEPSLVFLGGTQTRFMSPEHAAAAIARGERAVVIVDERGLAAFRAALPASVTIIDRAQVQGFNYSRGKYLHMHVLTPSH